MANESTLMAHLIPHLTDQVENAATEALGYILNKSEPSREALADLLREGGFAMPSIDRVATQVTLEDKSRPDMAGYNNGLRLLVESKFWAALLSGQACGYLQRIIDESGPAALLFIAPGVRIESLWSEILQQIDADRRCRSITLCPTVSASGWRRADVSGVQKRLALVSWERLLNDMAERADDDAADIRQLQGLVQRQIQGVALRQDESEFPPLSAEEISSDFGRRMFGYANLVDDMVARGSAQEWMSTKGLKATPRRYGYGRYFRFAGVRGYFWFGINYVSWARREDTPLWLRRSHDKNGWELDDNSPKNWFPIHIKTGVEYHEILDGVAAQLKEKARDFGANPPE